MLPTRGIRVDWKKFFISCAVVYTVFFYFSLIPSWFSSISKNRISLEDDYNPHYLRPAVNNSKNAFEFVYRGEVLYVDEVLTALGMPALKDRMTPPTIKSIKRIFSQSDFQARNLGGCLDWKCEITTDPNQADAFINSFPDTNNSFNGYILFSTQESPVYYGISENPNFRFNMCIGFRHDSPVASPYGYTVRLSEKSWRHGHQISNESLISGKRAGAVWFASHCTTSSKREKLVERLQKYIPVDIYGSCGTKTCPKRNPCESKINTDYHFYLALENSICKDYITEKMWYQGYSHTVIPIVLKRKLVEDYVPPNSFIAFDDYASIKDMGEHLKRLMNNKTEYKKYFEWRQKYEVIFLDGRQHDRLERPWGICQLCRLLHSDPLPQYSIPDIGNYWVKTCEYEGETANKLLLD